MNDNFCPTIDIEIIKNIILESGQVEDEYMQIGDSFAFSLKNKVRLDKKLIILRDIGNGQVNYEQATGIAIRFKKIGTIIKWFEENKKWKDGGYIE